MLTVPDKLRSAALRLLERVRLGLDIPSRSEVLDLATRLEAISTKLEALEARRAEDARLVGELRTQVAAPSKRPASKKGKTTSRTPARSASTRDGKSTPKRPKKAAPQPGDEAPSQAEKGSAKTTRPGANGTAEGRKKRAPGSSKKARTKES